MKGILSLLAYALIALAMFYCLPTHAHDWYSGIRNPTTGVGCCGGHDCGMVDVERVTQTDTEFIVDGKWRFQIKDAMPSQDGAYHACIWGGKPRCFFYPTNT